MERTIGVVEAGREFASIVQEVARGDNYVVESTQGEPVAVLVSVELYEQWKRERAEFLAKIHEIQSRANLSPDEADQVANEAVQYAQLQRRREAFFDQAEETAARANLSPEEADRLAEEAVQAVRAAHKRA